MRIILIKVSLLIFSSFLAYILSYFIAEKFFFDELFYRKSLAHGYATNLLYPIDNSEKKFPKRATDIRSLISLTNHQDFEQETVEKLFSIDSDTYIVVTIGDSFFYGLGVNERDIFVSKLERKLNKIRKSRVINLSLSGDNILENYSKLQLALKYIDPDLIIFGMVENDLVLEERKKYPNQSDLFAYFKRVCPDETITGGDHDVEYSWEEQVLEFNYPASQDKYANTCFFDRMVQSSPNEKIIYYSLSHSPLPEKIPSDPLEIGFLVSKLLSVYESAVKQNGGYLMLFPQDEFLGVTDKEGHPSKETHSKFSEYLYTEISTKTDWGFQSD